jgi:hypothetical protein
MLRIGGRAADNGLVGRPHLLIVALCCMAITAGLAALLNGLIAVGLGALVVAAALAIVVPRARTWTPPRRMPSPWVRAHPRGATLITAISVSIALFPVYYMICSGVWWAALAVDLLAFAYVARGYLRYIRDKNGETGQ